MAPKTKINLKDRFEDGELDLSLSELQEVPVREIAAMKKATSLDLSNNRLTSLGKNFIILTNIIKLDLSKNLLTELPEDFGEMKQLKHLDLYHNQLTHLPLSFYQLKSLKWLDLKNNPLVPAVAKVAGPCLDQQQCMQCAKNIVNFFAQMKDQIEEEKLRLEKVKQAELEVELANQKKQQKKKEKNKASKAKKNKLKAERKLESQNIIQEQFIDYVKEPVVKNGIPKTSKPSKKKSNSIKPLIKKSFYFIILSSIALFLYTTLKSECALNVKQKTSEMWLNLVTFAPVTVQPWAEKFADNVGKAHNITGKLVENSVEYFQEISKNENVQNGLDILAGVWNLLFSEGKKICIALGDQAVVLRNEMKRIFVENF